MATTVPEVAHSGLMYYLGAVGAIIGLGKLLESDEKITVRKALGRAIVSGGLGGAASLLLIPLPNVPLPVVVGAACAASSLGTAFLANLLQKYVERK